MDQPAETSPPAVPAPSAQPPQIQKVKGKGRRSACLWVGLGLLVVGLLMGGLLLSMMGAVVGGVMRAGMSEELGTKKELLVDPGDRRNGKVVRVDVSGMISNFGSRGLSGGSMVDEVKSSLRQAREDEEVKAVVLYVNSPGGEVTASDVLYEAVRQTQEVKPVVVYMDTVAASGGYYIACGGGEILANPTTMTGSIGVIIQTFNYAELFEKAGLRSVVFASGDFKDTLSGGREMREDEAEYVQGMVDGMYRRFLSIVSEGRQMEEARLRNGIADGRIFSGAEAEKLGLIDGLGYVEDAYERARELGGASGAPVVRYSSEVRLGDLLGLFAGGEAGVSTVEVKLPGLGGGVELEPGMMYYLPAHLAP